MPEFHRKFLIGYLIHILLLKEKVMEPDLGFPMVHGIVTRNKGIIRVKSAPGQGSTFDIYLPAFDASMEEKIESVETFAWVIVRRILFVDDEPFQTQMGKEHLERIGYSVENL